MGKIHTGDSVTASVYQAHKERVANTVRYEPSRDVQGYCIDQMMTHSKIVIENEDATSLNCATFDDFGTIFGIIEDESGIRYDRVSSIALYRKNAVLFRVQTQSWKRVLRY